MPAMTIQEITKCIKNKTLMWAFCRFQTIGTCKGFKDSYGTTCVLFKECTYPNEERWLPACDVKVATEEQIADWKESRIRDLEARAKYAVDEIHCLKERINALETKHKHWWSWK